MPPKTGALRVLALLTVVALVGTCAADLVSTAVDITLGGKRIAFARRPTDALAGELTTFALTSLAAKLAVAAAFAVAGVLFVSWLFRARRNLTAFDVAHLKWGPGWTIGSWFIPLANLVIPARVVNEVAQASIHPDQEDYWFAIRRRRVLNGFWWAAYLLMNIVGAIDSLRVQLTLRQHLDVDQLVANQAAAVTLGVLSIVLTIPAAVLAALVVLRITRDQEQRAVTEAQRAVPAPAVAQPFAF